MHSIDETLRIQRSRAFQCESKETHLRIGSGAPHAYRLVRSEHAMEISCEAFVAVSVDRTEIGSGRNMSFAKLDAYFLHLALGHRKTSNRHKA